MVNPRLIRQVARLFVVLLVLISTGCLASGGAAPVTVTPAPVPIDGDRTTATESVSIPTHGGQPVATLGPDGPGGEVSIPTHGGEPVAEA